jgi:NodT family efflux transporter outer membrane factor (OMF) lipoprotein
MNIQRTEMMPCHSAIVLKSFFSMCLKKYHIFCLIILFSVFFSGCSVHNSEVGKVSVSMPSSYMANAGKEELDSRWWRVFGDRQLDELVERALSGNLDIYAALSRLEQARAVYRQANAVRFPFISFQGEAARSKVPSFFEDVTGGTYRVSFQAGYELDLWQKYRNASDAASFEVNATREEIKGLYISIAAQVVDLYFVALEQKAQIEMTREIIRSAEDTLTLVQRRYEGGLVEAVDVYQARQTLESARARLPVYETLLEQAEHALAALCGEFPEQEVSAIPDALPDVPPLPDAGVPAELIERRPDIQSAFYRLRAQDARVAVAVADLYPAFRIGGSIGQSQALMTSSPIVGEFWEVFAGVTQPLFEGGRRIAERDRAYAAFVEAVANYKKTVINAVREVEDAISACRGSEKRVKNLEKWVDAASSSMSLVKNRYFWGVSEYLPVLTMQASELEARSQLINARRVHLSNFIGLVKALGGDWMDDELRAADNGHLLSGEISDK